MFTQSGGVNTISETTLGDNSGGKGTYILSGGLMSKTGIDIVGHGGGFVQSGGTNSLSGSSWLWLGGVAGTYTLSGTGQLSATQICVGHYGTGVFNQSAGTNCVTNLTLGFSNGDVGTYNLSGGTNCVTNLAFGGGNGATGIYNLSGGMLILSQLTTNSTGTFNFSGGTLQASSAFSAFVPMTLGAGGGGATFDTAGYTVTLSGVISGPGNLTKVDSGTLVLSAANTYTGLTTVNAGVLSLIGSLNSSSALVLGGGAFSYAPTANGDSGNRQTVAGLTVNVGASSVSASAGSPLALGPITRNPGGTVGFDANATGTITTTQANTNGILGPWSTYGSGTSMKYAAASGSSAPYTIAPYTGATAITSGVAGLTDTTGTVNYALSGGGGTLTAAVSANTLQFTGAANMITASSANPLSLNGIMNVGSGTAAIAGGNLIIGSTRELVFTGPGNVTIGAAIQDNGSGPSALTMAGSGTLLLSGANAYGGDTVVAAGTLKLGNAAALPQGVNSGNLSLFGTLDLNNFSPNLNGLSGNGVVTSSAAGSPTLTVGDNNATSTFGGVIQNGVATALALTKTGSGTLSLTGSNTYTGPTAINAGGLVVGGSLGSTAVTVGGGARLGGTGSIGGTVVVLGGATPSTQGAINLADGMIGTLTLSDPNAADTVLTLGGLTVGTPRSLPSRWAPSPTASW